jgi:hypothetical protein
MKKYVAATAMLVVFLALFIPFASSSPDGLEKVAKSLGVQQPKPVWSGLIRDYSVNAFGDSDLSTLAAGAIGIALVMGATLLLGTAIIRRSKLPKKDAATPEQEQP